MIMTTTAIHSSSLTGSDEEEHEEEVVLVTTTNSSSSAEKNDLLSMNSSSAAAASDVSMAELLIHELSFWDPTPKELMQLVVQRRSRSFDDGLTKQKMNSSSAKTSTKSKEPSRSQSLHVIWKDHEEEKKTSHSPPSSSSSSSSSSSKNETNIVAQLEELKKSNTWEKALDAGTGKYYYYCRVTRQSQWDKPRSVREIEKLTKILQRKESEAFFRSMEANIYASLARGELIPNIRDPLPKEGPPLEPPTSSHNNNNTRVRTISGMNEHLLAELQAQSAFATTSATSRGNNNNNNNNNNHQHHSSLSSTKTNQIEKGRPPLPPSMAAAVPTNHSVAPATSSLSLNPLPNNNSTTTSPDDDLLELSPDWESQPSHHKTTIINESEGLQGLDYLLPEENATTTNQTQPSQLEQPPSNKSSIGRPAPLGIHMRRNTSSNYYVRETMEKPDIDATIQCVCGVLRAHIVNAASSANHPPPTLPPHVVRIDWTIFQDAPTHRTTRNSATATTPVKIPSLEEIKAFYREFYQRSQMEHDTIIMSLIYVERLIKETHGALTPSPDNWMSLLFACMILASKVWDDLSMWNVDFSNVSVSSSSLKPFSLQRINELELAVLTCLRFAVTIPASEYAKYFFLLRTMMIRGGLAKIMPPNPTQEHASALEVRTSHYQDTILVHNHQNDANGAPRRRQTRSVDWSWVLGQKSTQSNAGAIDEALLSSMASSQVAHSNVDSGFSSRPDDEPSIPSGPVLREQVCLEQLTHT